MTDPTPAPALPEPITTSTGTTVRLEEHVGSTLVLLHAPAAPVALRDTEAGRIVDGGFQPAPFAAWTLSPETLRAVADLIERSAR